MPKISKENIALIFASVGWFLVLSGRLSISTLLVDIEASFSMDHTTAGLALTGMWFFYGLMQFPSGVVSDVKGRRVTILAAMALFAVSYLLLGLSVHAFMFFSVLILLGIGAGSFPTAGIAMLSDLFRERRGKALGIQSSFGSMAGLTPIIAPVIAAAFHWRAFFLLWAVISLFTVYLFFLFSEESTRLPTGVSLVERFKDGMAVFRDKSTLFVFGVNLTVVFTWMAFTSFYPLYLIESKGFSELQAGISFAILSFGGFLLKPLVGALSDRYNKKAIVFFLIFIAVIAINLLIHFSSFPAILTISFVLSITTSIFLVSNSYLMHRWEVRGRGGKLGFYRSIMILVSSPTSVAVGWTATHYNFDLPFLILSMMLSGAAVVLLFSLVRDRYVWYMQKAGS